MEENKIVLTYAGSRIDSSETEYHFYNGADRLIFAKMLKNVPQIVGVQIECTKTENGVKSPYVVKGYDTSHENIQDWRTEDNIAKNFMAAKKKASKNRELLAPEIDVIRYHYKQLPASQRSVFLTVLIYNITK